MGEDSAVSKCPSDPRSGLTCIVRLWESTFALRAVNEQTFLNLRTTEHASENVKVARHLRRQRSGEFPAEEKRKMDNTIWQTHTAVHSLSKLLEPARVDRVDMYGDEKISLSTKGLWVLNESPGITAAFDQVQAAHEALDEVIGSLQSPRMPDRFSPALSISQSTPSTEINARPVPYDASQLLAWRRQSRMNIRRDAARPLKTEGLGVQGTSDVEFAFVPPASHSMRSATMKAAAQPESGVTLKSQRHDQLQDQNESSAESIVTSPPEAQPRVPLKSPSRVSLQTQYPSPPQSDTGSPPRPQHYAATTPPHNSYYSPPQSSHGNTPQSQYQISPRSQPSAPLQDQYQTSLQIEYQNALRDQQTPFVSFNNASIKQFEVVSEIEYKPRLPRGHLPRQNPNELPPERQYHIPQPFLTRTRSKYRYNAAPGDRQYEGPPNAQHDQPTPQAQPIQTFLQREERQQQYQASPRLRFQDQLQHDTPVPQSPKVQLQYHNPGPFFLGERERPQNARSASEPAWLPSQPQTPSRCGYRLPMVFEENLYGGLEVVRPEDPEPISNNLQLQSQPQINDRYKGIEVADPELESVSTRSQSQHDLDNPFSSAQREPVIAQFQPHKDVGNPYSHAQQEVVTTNSRSQYDLGNPYSQMQQESVVTSSQSDPQTGPVITHTQSLNEANNPYARSNKRKSWLAWQASRSITARGLNDRYSL